MVGPAPGSKWDKDLNQNAGGDYIYLCAARTAGGAAITGLSAVAPADPILPTPNACGEADESVLANRRLGHSVTKNRVNYLCVQRGGGGAPIAAVEGIVKGERCRSGFQPVGTLHGNLSSPFIFDIAGIGVTLCAGTGPRPCPPAPPRTHGPIRDLSVLATSAIGVACCPNGTGLVNTGRDFDGDYNAGAGGDYIFLCVRSETSQTGTSKEPITELRAFTTPSAADPFQGCPAGLEKIPAVIAANGSTDGNNMNAGSKNIGAMYLCASRNSSAADAITSLVGTLANSSCPAGLMLVRGVDNPSGADGAPFNFDPKGVGVHLCYGKGARSN